LKIRIMPLLSASVLLFALASCVPSRVTISIERLQPSQAKVDVVGQPVNLVYRGSADSLDLAFFNSIAGGFERSLNVVDSNGAYQFEFDSLAAGPFVRLGNSYDEDNGQVVYNISLPYNFVLNVMQGGIVKDSYLAKDELQWELRSSRRLPDDTIYNAVSREFYPTVSQVGENMAAAFFPQWVEETREIYTMDSGRWKEAENMARNFDWASAQRIWLELTKSENMDYVYAACYNMAISDEMLEDPEDGLEWIAFLEKYFPNNVPTRLKGRLQAMEK